MCSSDLGVGVGVVGVGVVGVGAGVGVGGAEAFAVVNLELTFQGDALWPGAALTETSA